MTDGSGGFFYGEAGETLADHEVVYINNVGLWVKADADSVTSPVIAIVVKGVPNGQPVKLLLTGVIGDNSWSWTVGGALYLSNTAGGLTQTAPVTGSHQKVGYALSSTLIYFNPGFNQEPENLSVNENNWDDLRFPASSVRLGGDAPATFQAYKDAGVLSFASNADKFIYVIAQMPHTWDTGTDIEAHVHWTIPTKGSAVGAENVKWDLTYSWSDVGGVIPDSSNDTLTRDVQSIAADLHMLDSFGVISGVGKIESSCLIISLKRDTSVANDYVSAVYLIEFDIHFKKNRFGTQTIPGNTP